MLKIDDVRSCPLCKYPIQGQNVSKENHNWFKFECNTCQEEWLEDTKYCLEKFDYPEDLTIHI